MHRVIAFWVLGRVGWRIGIRAWDSGDGMGWDGKGMWYGVGM